MIFSQVPLLLRESKHRKSLALNMTIFLHGNAWLPTDLELLVGMTNPQTHSSTACAETNPGTHKGWQKSNRHGNMCHLATPSSSCTGPPALGHHPQPGHGEGQKPLVVSRCQHTACSAPSLPIPWRICSQRSKHSAVLNNFRASVSPLLPLFEEEKLQILL
jgi:hypothetical protein